MALYRAFPLSDMNIGIVCEGITDYYVIEAALSKIIPFDFTATLIQPDVTPESIRLGEGWCGVFKWCSEILSHESTQTEILRNIYKIIIIHIDADVAQKHFRDCGSNYNNTPELPCDSECPPAEDTVNNLKALIESWMPANPMDDRTVICIPSKSSETWVVTALFGTNDPDILENIECNNELERYLAEKPPRERLIRQKDGRFRKDTSRFKSSEKIISNKWMFVTKHCREAKRFESNILSTLVLLDL